MKRLSAVLLSFSLFLCASPALGESLYPYSRSSTARFPGVTTITWDGRLAIAAYVFQEGGASKSKFWVHAVRPARVALRSDGTLDPAFGFGAMPDGTPTATGALSNWRYCSTEPKCGCSSKDATCSPADFRMYIKRFGISDPRESIRFPNVVRVENGEDVRYSFESHITAGRHPSASAPVPYRCNLDGGPDQRYECYDLLFTVAASRYAAQAPITKVMFGARAKVVVEAFHPGTSDRLENPVVQEAVLLEELAPLGTPSGKPVAGWEPSTTADGRMLVTSQGFYFNRGATYLSNNWNGPYSTAELFSHASDFDEARGLTLGQIYPLMARPLFDVNGAPCGVNCGGAYKWISADGSELFFTDGQMLNQHQESAPGGRTPKSLVKMVGPRTRYTETLVDGPLNENRFTWTGFMFSLGMTGTMWEPFPWQSRWKIPYVAKSPTYPMVTSSGVYQEIDFLDILDGTYLVRLPMNEQVTAGSTPDDETQPHPVLNSQKAAIYNCTDIRLGKLAEGAVCDEDGQRALEACTADGTDSPELRQCYFQATDVRRVSRVFTPDISGYFNTSVLEGGAQFPSEYYRSRGQIPRDENGAISENQGFVGRGVFLGPVGSHVRVPGSVANSKNPHCRATGEAWIDPSRCNLSDKTSPNYMHRGRPRLSVELAIRPLVGFEGRRTLVDKPGSFKLYLQKSGSAYQAVAAFFSTTGVERSFVTLPLMVGQWAHLGVVFDGASTPRRVTFYFNGAAVVKPITTARLAPSLSDWYVGGDSQASLDAAAPMVIDEFAVSSHARPLGYFARQARRPITSGVFVGGDTLDAEGVLPERIRQQLGSHTTRYSLEKMRFPFTVATVIRQGKFAQAYELGESLFSDPNLGPKGVACVTCHQTQPRSQTNAPLFIDRRRNPLNKNWIFDTSPGVNGQFTDRHTPALLNRVFSTHQMADGSAVSLVDQALMPVVNQKEMGGSEEALLRYLDTHPLYPAKFRAVFGAGNPTAKKFGTAIASFLVAQIEPPGAGDAALLDAASEEPAARGARIFAGKARCITCHSGPSFSDESFHNIGVEPADGHDLGRFKITQMGSEKRAFRTPTLRGISRTAPYFHNGSGRTLEQVVTHYVTTPRVSPRDPALDPELLPISLTADEIEALIAFLQTL